jgi:hypothetical protein
MPPNTRKTLRNSENEPGRAACADPDHLSQAQPPALSPALNRSRFPEYQMKSMTGKHLAHHRRSLPSRQPSPSPMP